MNCSALNFLLSCLQTLKITDLAKTMMLKLQMTQNGRCEMVPNGRLGLGVKAKDGRPKCPSAKQKSIWLSTIDCICKLALQVLAGRKRERKKQKNKKRPEQCVSIFRTQRAISLFSCLFYSKCHSVSESAFRALRQRCRCSGLNIYNHGQMGWVSRELGRGFRTLEDHPTASTSKLKAIKDHPTHCAAEGHCQISFRISPAKKWMLLLKKALQ